jgi:hypothetical protein
MSDYIGKRYYSISTQIIASSFDLTGLERAEAHNKSRILLRIGNRFVDTGLAMAGIGLLSWLVFMVKARRQSRHLTPVIPLVLLIVYFILFFLMV